MQIGGHFGRGHFETIYIQKCVMLSVCLSVRLSVCLFCFVVYEIPVANSSSKALLTVVGDKSSQFTF